MKIKIESEAAYDLFFCISIKRQEGYAIQHPSVFLEYNALSGLTKHHTQGTPNMEKELSIYIFILVQ